MKPPLDSRIVLFPLQSRKKQTGRVKINSCKSFSLRYSANISSNNIFRVVWKAARESLLPQFRDCCMENSCCWSLSDTSMILQNTFSPKWAPVIHSKSFSLMQRKKQNCGQFYFKSINSYSYPAKGRRKKPGFFVLFKVFFTYTRRKNAANTTLR